MQEHYFFLSYKHETQHFFMFQHWKFSAWRLPFFFNKPMISKLEYWVKIDWGIVSLLTHGSQNESAKSVIFIERLELSHENILKCLGISNEPNNLPCLLFEFMQFGDLASILANTRTKNIQKTNLITLTDVRTFWTTDQIINFFKYCIRLKRPVSQIRVQISGPEIS